MVTSEAVKLNVNPMAKDRADGIRPKDLYARIASMQAKKVPNIPTTGTQAAQRHDKAPLQESKKTRERQRAKGCEHK